MTKIQERIIGRKAIMNIFDKLYGITTWHGCVYCIKHRKMPIRRTLSGKPFFISSELIKFDQKAQEFIPK